MKDQPLPPSTVHLYPFRIAAAYLGSGSNASVLQALSTFSAWKTFGSWKGRYEGIHLISARHHRGEIVESPTTNPHASAEQRRISLSALQPFRLESGGKLQVCRLSPKARRDLVFGSKADADITSQDTKDLHTRLQFQTTWVRYDTATQALPVLRCRAKPLVASL